MGSHDNGGNDAPFLRQRGFRVHVLNSRDTSTEFNRLAVGGEDQFEFGDDGKQIVKIEEAEVGDPEDLSLHRALPVGDDGIEASAKFFHNDARIHSGWRA